MITRRWLLMKKKEAISAPADMEIIDYLETPMELPPWISEEDLPVSADKFEKSGFTGPFNRAMDVKYELAPWQGSIIRVPTKFLIGDKEIGFELAGTKEYVHRDDFKCLVPDLEVVVLDGHHFIQQERAQQVSERMLAFICKLSPG